MKLASLIAVAGIAAAAGAQTMTYTWTVSDDGNGDGIIEPGESAMLTLSALMDPDQSANDGGFAGSIYEILGGTNWDTGVVAVHDNLLDALTDDGTLVGNDITNIESFQLPLFFNPFFDASNPIDIYKITWTPNDYSSRTVEVSDANHQNNDVYTDNFGTSIPYQAVVNGASFRVVPAPASLALLGLGGLVANRRRR